MTYGFKFTNNNNELVIDDSNVKPWLTTGSYFGYNYQTFLNYQFNELLEYVSMKGIPGITDTYQEFYVYSIDFVAPNNANCIVACTIPDGNSGALYSTETAATFSNDAQRFLTGTDGYYPSYRITVAVPKTYINTASAQQLLYLIPKVYYFSTDAINAPGGGYGAQVFKQNSQCVFDTNKKHVPLAPYSFAYVESPPSNYAVVGPNQWGAQTRTHTVTGFASDTEKMLVVMPAASAVYITYGFQANTKGLVTERTFYGRRGNTLYTKTYATSSNTIGFNGVNGAIQMPQIVYDNLDYGRYNNGTETLQDIISANAYRETHYNRLLILDGTGLDLPYTPVEFPAGYSLSSSTGTTRLVGEAFTDGYYTTELKIILTTSNVANGTRVYYTIDNTGNNRGMTSADISFVLAMGQNNTNPATFMNGYFEVQSNRAEITVIIKEDAIIGEGTEILRVGLDNGRASVAVDIPENKEYRLTETSQPVRRANGITNYNEGSTISYEIRTKNVPLNTPIYYEIVAASQPGETQSFSAADIGRTVLTGSTTISSIIPNSNTGTGTISFTLANDLLQEGEETFYLTLTNLEPYPAAVKYFDPVYITVLDTSAPRTYSLKYGTQTSGNVTISEGVEVTFTIVSQNVPDGTRVYPSFTDSTFSVDDFIVPNTWYNPSVGLTGVVINNNIGIVTFTVKADSLTEGIESGLLKIFSTPDNTIAANILATYSGSIVIQDTSLSIPHTITSNVNSVNEGQAFQLDMTVGQYTGTPIYWRITGVDTSDIQDIAEQYIYYDGDGGSPQTGWSSIGVSLTGTFTFDTSLTKSFLITMRNDSLLEGQETLGFTLRSNSVDGNVVASKSIGINDTSVPTYIMYNDTIYSENPRYISEGGTVRWDIYTTGVPNGTRLYWTNAGTTNGSDFNDGYGSLNYGDVLIMNNAGWFARTLRNDITTEGTENIIMQLRTGGNGTDGVLKFTDDTIQVGDTSTDPTAIIYPTTTSVNEGGTVRWWIETSNVPDETLLYWNNTGTATGADFNDVYGNTNQGQVLIRYSGGWFERTISNDATTEGLESIIMQLRLNSNSGTLLATSENVYINDTSRRVINEIFTVTPSSVVFPSGVEVKVTGGTPNGTIRWSLNIQDYEGTLQLDANGFISSGPASTSTAGANLQPGFYTLYFYFPETGNYRQASWTVTAANPAAGTLLSTFCSGTTKYGTYADGSGGTYNQVIQTNSTECGYTAPAALQVTNYSLDSNDFGNIDAYGLNSAAYDGLRCKGAQRNSIDMFVSRTFTVNKTAKITGRLKVGSEQFYDFGYLYLDGVEIAKGSGIYDSGDLVGTIAAGTHTVMCRYTKDSSVSTGLDEALVEYSITEP